MAPPSPASSGERGNTPDRNRQFIVFALTGTLCIVFLLATVSVLFFRVPTDVALALTGSLTAVLSPVIAFNFPAERK